MDLVKLEHGYKALGKNVLNNVTLRLVQSKPDDFERASKIEKVMNLNNALIKLCQSQAKLDKKLEELQEGVEHTKTQTRRSGVVQKFETAMKERDNLQAQLVDSKEIWELRMTNGMITNIFKELVYFPIEIKKLKRKISQQISENERLDAVTMIHAYKDQHKKNLELLEKYLNKRIKLICGDNNISSDETKEA